MDACCWLLDQGTRPDHVTWVRPRDSWILNRAYFQPAAGVVPTFEGVVLDVEAVVECDSIEHVFERLEGRTVVSRLDRSVWPSMLRGATASLGEIDVLRRVENVIRLGHIERIDPDAIVLQDGSVPTSPEHLHVHCAAAGLSDDLPKPIFATDKILLQPVTRASLSLSAGLLGFVEASGRSVTEKNRLCPPNSWFHTPFDWIRHLLSGMKTEMAWQSAPDLSGWLEDSRLNLVKGLDRQADKASVAELQGRFVSALIPALAKLDDFASRATDAERKRMFEPIASRRAVTWRRPFQEPCQMALFLDRHNVPGATAAEVAAAHELDLALQDKYHVRYVTYWFDEGEGSVFCLAEGPDRESLEAVHRDAHGLVADNIIEVGEGPINAFLGDVPRHPPGEPYVESAVRAIVFTDLCDSTQQTQELGDQGFMVFLREHDEIVRTALRDRSGREVKHTGDGIMASFASVAAAVEAGLDMQRCLRRRNADADRPLHIRIGISAGEPVTEGDDLFGATVQLSARLCAVASRGGIAVSNAVRELCLGKSLGFDSMGNFELKGFPEPVPVYAVRISDD